MFGFGLKSKSKRVLDEHFGMGGYCVASWLNQIVKDGKDYGYNEFDVAIWYKLTDMKFEHDSAVKYEEAYPLRVNELLHNTKEEIYKIEHLASKNTGFKKRLDDIIAASDKSLNSVK